MAAGRRHERKSVSCLVTFARAGIGKFLVAMAGGRHTDHQRIGRSLPRILPAKNFKGKATNRHPTPKSKFATKSRSSSNPTQRLHHGSRRHQKVIRRSFPKECRVFITNKIRSKKKWAKDPNNTAWSRNTDTFGQKILRSQGWAPGQYLGAENASHSEYYGAANATHIRAVLKDDSLGLGAKRNQGDECTGLDALQDLLSRLNGKSEESLGEEQKKREDLKINKYLHRKLGTVTFVYGGLLVGDKVQELADSMKNKTQDAAQVPGSEDTSGESSEAGKKEKKSKKRKAEDAEGVQSELKKEKKFKKSKSQDADEDSKSKRKEKKDKKKRKEKDEDSSPDDADEDASDRKKAKKEKKEKRRKAKLENDDEDAADASHPKKSKKSKKKSKTDTEQPTPQPTESSTPTASGTSTPSIPTRHLARSRFIAQKRAAVMDQAALNQIFMIKT